MTQKLGIVALVATLMASPSFAAGDAAGGAGPVTDVVIIEEAAGSAGGDNWVGIFMTLLLFGTAVSN